MDIYGIVFFTFAFAYMAFIVVIESRFFMRRLLSGHRPTTTATIRAEWLGSLGSGTRAAFFTYDFTVREVACTGRFAVIYRTSEDQGRKLLERPCRLADFDSLQPETT
jgi:hypothetical protein